MEYKMGIEMNGKAYTKAKIWYNLGHKMLSSFPPIYLIARPHAIIIIRRSLVLNGSTWMYGFRCCLHPKP